MTNPKGGRGNVAPYNTVIVRVPESIKFQVDAIASTYKALKLAEKEQELEEFLNRVETAIVSISYKPSTNLLTLEEAREVAKKLVAQKKSKEVTIQKLLQVLYKQE